VVGAEPVISQDLAKKTKQYLGVIGGKTCAGPGVQVQKRTKWGLKITPARNGGDQRKLSLELRRSQRAGTCKLLGQGEPSSQFPPNLGAEIGWGGENGVWEFG